MPAALAALIEAAGAEALLAIALFSTFAAYLASRGLLVTWTSTFGKMFVWLADNLNFRLNLHFAHPHIDLGGPFRTANNAVVNSFESWASHTEASMAWTWRAMGTVWRANVAAVEWASHELADSMEWLLHVRLPKWARAAFAVAFPLGYLTKLIYDQVRKFVVHPIRTIKVIERSIPRTVVRVVKSTASVALPSPWAFPKFRRSWRELEIWRKVTAKRLRNLELAIAGAGLALGVARMTGTRLSCWRGQGNIVRSLRHICGFPRWLVDLLVIGTVESFAAADLCDFSDLLIKTAEGLKPGLLALVDVENALVGCHDFTAPRTLALPPVSLPPLVDAVSLAA